MFALKLELASAQGVPGYRYKRNEKYHQTLFYWPESLEGRLRVSMANKRLEECIMSQNQNPNQKPGQQQQGNQPGQQPGQQGGGQKPGQQQQGGDQKPGQGGQPGQQGQNR